ncbi:MAG: 30S ribosomal protein S17 [Nanoarchaeota archaeon]
MKDKKQNKIVEAKTQFELPSQTRGRIFEGTVTKKFPTRVVIEFQRTVRVPKYQRFYMKRSRMHARIPAGMQIQLGDYIKIQECRPLSKIIHSIVIEKVRSADVQEVKK